MCNVQNMRTKRDIVIKQPGVYKHSDKKTTGKKKNTDNPGEAFVRRIAQTSLPKRPCTQNNEPFEDVFDDIVRRVNIECGIQKQDTGKPCDGTSSNSTQEQQQLMRYTKFHLEDDEMLMELMMHLTSDCPDMMRNKQKLIDNVSRIFDQITK
jgi:hypothetical protein